MLKHSFLAVACALLVSQPVLANRGMMGDPDETKSKHCEMIAKACKDAGYTRDNGKGKLFWFDCMKPILHNESVKGVGVDKTVVHACRNFKIKNLEDQIHELKKYNNE